MHCYLENRLFNFVLTVAGFNFKKTRTAASRLQPAQSFLNWS
jgi:arylamine N-acetyltransferase